MDQSIVATAEEVAWGMSVLLEVIFARVWVTGDALEVLRMIEVRGTYLRELDYAEAIEGKSPCLRRC